MGLILLLCVAAATINLPFGFYRAAVPRFSRQWFLAIHIPVPLVIIVRLLSGESWNVIPLLIFSAILGQMAGGFIRSASRGQPAEHTETEKVTIEPDEHQTG